MNRVLLALCGVAVCLSAAAADPAASARGKKALEETAFIPGFWPAAAYDLAWKSWGVAEKPKDYDTAFRNRYGLPPAPYPNAGLPMGLRPAPMIVGKGIGIDCMTCHGGSILGKSVIGLGNSTLDIQALFEELYRASNLSAKLPFTFSNVRGTTEAAAFAVSLLGYRTPELNLKPDYTDLGLKDDACEDVPAWWLLKKKRTMYHSGGGDATSVRSLMQFMMHPLALPADFAKHEPTFRDVRQFLLSIEAPKYPFAIDKELAEKGERLFKMNCAKCHGTYGEEWTYPNKIIPLEEISTDRKRYEAVGPAFAKAYDASWFAKEKAGWFLGGKPGVPSSGYQAPPLDGVWATAPYFHNGSVPTLDGVLNSKARPAVYTRSFRTGEDEFDKEKVGWKVRAVPPPGPEVPAFERRKVYDTSLPGRSNRGHLYGDGFSPAERKAVIEYLKTL
jgi:RoxA-like, cytochrome c-like